ncbi:MAG TPA: hypothetical protein DCX54_03500 [Flavobacteriales bacterium]|nr:hypothetical protein [Flavobacteriales bacterium]
MKPLIVEFLGTQGSGKTTLLPMVVAFFREKGMQANSVTEAARLYAQRTLLGKLISIIAPGFIRDKLLWQVYYQKSVVARLIFNLKNRSLVSYINKTQRARPAGAGVRERRIRYWFSHLSGIYTFLKMHALKNEILVFDDGFVHRVVHLNASSIETPQRGNIVEYLSRIPLPILLIVPRVPLDECVNRVENRGIWKHFRDRTQDDLRQYLANSEYIVNIAVDELRAKGCLVIEVDNNHADVRETFAELGEKMKSMELFPLPS